MVLMFFLKMIKVEQFQVKYNNDRNEIEYVVQWLLIFSVIVLNVVYEGCGIVVISIECYQFKFFLMFFMKYFDIRRYSLYLFSFSYQWIFWNVCIRYNVLIFNGVMCMFQFQEYIIL